MKDTNLTFNNFKKRQINTIHACCQEKVLGSKSSRESLFKNYCPIREVYLDLKNQKIEVSGLKIALEQ